jgi:hypothetical protein
MKKFSLISALLCCSAVALANSTPQLSLDLSLSKSLQGVNYLIDADACEYTKNTCDDSLPGTVHDHQSRSIGDGWTGWQPNWKAVPSNYQLVNYHVNVRLPSSWANVAACGTGNHELTPTTKHVSLRVFKLFGHVHCVMTVG